MRNWNNFRGFPEFFLLFVFTLPMRNWNPFGTNFLVLSSKFLLYLWGIETGHKISRLFGDDSFLLYLWGIETTFQDQTISRNIPVFTLPMRNWNPDGRRVTKGVHEFLLYLWGIETILEEISWVAFLVFLLYLWGIETSRMLDMNNRNGGFYSTYEELKLSTARGK